MSNTSSQAGSGDSGKGPEGMQRMLEGQDNTKLAGAKEALKKKILRMVMQQAMEELGDPESLADVSLDSIGMRQEDLDRLSGGVRKHLIRQAAQAVGEADFDGIAEAAAQAAIESTEVGDAASRVERKILGAVSERALEGLSDDEGTIKRAFDSIADANGGAIEALADSVKDKLFGAIAARAWSGGIDAEKVVDKAAEHIDVEHPSVREAIERIQSSAGDLILQTVMSQLNSSEATTSLADEASRRYRERIIGVVTERVSSDADALADAAQKEVGPEHEVVIKAIRKTRGGLIEVIRERAIAAIDDPKAAAREAFIDLNTESALMSEAVSALRRRLTATIADKALAELGDAAAASEAALAVAREQETVVSSAANAVYETMARHVAEQARERCLDPEGLAEAARDYMDPKEDHVARAVGVLQTRLTALVASRAVASLQDDSKMAMLAQEAAKREEPIIQTTVDKLHDELIQDIIYKVGESFSDAGDTARKAKERMGTGNAAIIAANEVLKELVLEDLAKQATYTLLEPEKAGQKAFERIDTNDPRFQRSADKTREQLIAAIAEHGLAGLTPTEETAKEARTLINESSDPIVSATAVLRDMLINEIAKRGTDSLDDTRAVAKQSRGRIEADDPSMGRASEALRDMLLQDLVKMTRSALSDAEAAADAAMSHLNTEDEVFTQVRAVFRERVLMNVLGEAMREIGQSAGGPNHEANMFQQALHAMTARGSDRAGAWNGSGYQPASPAPDRGANGISAEPPVLSVSTAAGMTSTAGQDNSWEERDPSFGKSKSGFNFQATVTIPSVPVPATSESLGRSTGQGAVAPTATPVMEDWGTASPTEGASFFAEPASTDGWVRLSDINQDEPDRMVALDPPEAMSSSDMEDVIVTEFVDVDESELDYDEEETWSPASGVDPTGSATKPARTPQNRSTQPSQGSERREAPAAAREVPAATQASSEPASAEKGDIDMTWSADDGFRCYVYGFVAAPEISASPPEGVETLESDHGVRFVSLRGVRAIVSRVRATDFGEESLKEHSQDAEWLKARIRKHATVLDSFKTRGTVMPVRFGSVYDSEADVAIMMGAEYDQIEETLDRLKDKQEWSVRVTRDSDRLSERLASSERNVQDSLGAISAGVAQFIRDEMDKSPDLHDDELIAVVTENCIRRSHDALMPWAIDGAQKALFTAPGVDMVFNAAYLVENGQRSDFEAEVERLSKELEPLGFSFDLTGPWPAYHFVDADENGAAELVSVQE